MITIIPEHYLILNTLFLFVFFILNSLSLKHNLPKINISFLIFVLLINTLILAVCDLTIGNLYFNNLFLKLNYQHIISILLIVMSSLILIPINKFNSNYKINTFEYYIILLISIIALYLLLSAQELISFYFLIEIQSISFYILASYNKFNKNSIESGIKYFVLSTLSSIFILIGFAIIYSVSGLISFTDVSIFFIDNYSNTVIVYISLLAITSSFLFKLYVAPFHFWIADIYQGSPNSSVLIYSTLPQLIFYFIYFYLLNYVFNSFNIEISYLFLILTILTMVIGVILALYQTKIKRVIAYSSIINIGYVLVNFYYNNNLIFINSLLFIAIYTINLLTFFLILSNLYDYKNKIYFENISNLNGLYNNNKELSIILIVCLFSLAGIPFFSLFYSKLLIITSLITQSAYFMVFFLIIITCITAFIYIRIIKNISYIKSNRWVFIKPIDYISSFFIIQLILFHIYYGFNLDILSTSVLYSTLSTI